MEPRKYGYIKDPPSPKDKLYSVRMAAKPSIPLPPSTNNVATAPPVVNQGSLGSCTANAIGANLQHDQIMQGIPNFMPSRLFIYYNERLAEGHKNEDSGACIRTGIKVVAHLGAPEEALWPYDTEKYRKCPPLSAYAAARSHQALEYYRIDNTNLNEVKTCLAGGHGIVIGFQVYDSFETEEVTRTGVLPFPAPGERNVGGHAVYVVDYNDEITFPAWDGVLGGVLIQNSWGTEWGLAGRFWVPYRFLTDPNMVNDCWTIRKVEA